MSVLKEAPGKTVVYTCDANLTFSYLMSCAITVLKKKSTEPIYAGKCERQVDEQTLMRIG